MKPPEARRRLLFPYFLVLQLLFTSQVAISTYAGAMGDASIISSFLSRKCDIKDPPSWCGTPDTRQHLVQEIQTNMQTILWGMAACALLLFLTLCTTFRAASERTEGTQNLITMRTIGEGA